MSSLPPEAKDIADLQAHVHALESQVRDAFASVGVAFPVPPPLPPHRAELPSQIDFAELADKLVEGVRSGLARDDTSPEEQVRKIVAEEDARRSEIRDLTRLRLEEEKRTKDAAERRKSVRQIVIAAAGGLSFTGVIELVKWIVSLHH